MKLVLLLLTACAMTCKLHAQDTLTISDLKLGTKDSKSERTFSTPVLRTYDPSEIIFKEATDVHLPLGITWYSDNEEVVTTYDTTVLHDAGKSCKHDWAYEKTDFFRLIQVCSVNHDAAGCPDTWNKQKRICTSCLRHELISEARTVKEIHVPDPYIEALDKLKKKGG